MGKPALGKGLGELMAGQRPPATGSQPAGQPVVTGKVTPVDFGRGLSTLVAPGPNQKTAESAPPLPLLPVWFFFAADVLLLAFTLAICLDAGEVMEFGELLFALASTAVAAFLGIVGVLRGGAANAVK
jgi:hypothetical protein